MEPVNERIGETHDGCVTVGLTRKGDPRFASPRWYATLGYVLGGMAMLEIFLQLSKWTTFPRIPIYSLLGLSFVGGMAGMWVSYGRRQKWLTKLVEGESGRICLKCGYILSHLPETHHCPECGIPYDIAVVQKHWRSWLDKTAGLS